jgi:hypothetical protein
LLKGGSIMSPFHSHTWPQANETASILSLQPGFHCTQLFVSDERIL